MSPFENPMPAAPGQNEQGVGFSPLDPKDIAYRAEQHSDAEAIDALADEAFGPGRYVRAAERVRELFPALRPLCLVATSGEDLVGSVRMSHLVNRSEKALMLGPLIVRPRLKGIGIGKALLRRSAEEARKNDFKEIFLVGDSPYYAFLGYQVVEQGRITLPRPVDPSRVLVLKL